MTFPVSSSRNKNNGQKSGLEQYRVLLAKAQSPQPAIVPLGSGFLLKAEPDIQLLVLATNGLHGRLSRPEDALQYNRANFEYFEKGSIFEGVIGSADKFLAQGLSKS